MPLSFQIVQQNSSLTLTFADKISAVILEKLKLAPNDPEMEIVERMWVGHNEPSNTARTIHRNADSLIPLVLVGLGPTLFIKTFCFIVKRVLVERITYKKYTCSVTELKIFEQQKFGL